MAPIESTLAGLKQWRVTRGLTQARLTEKMGYDIRTVQRAEAGNAVSLQTVADLALISRRCLAWNPERFSVWMEGREN